MTERADPFGWDGPRGGQKPKAADDFYKDDGWGEVRDSEREMKKQSYDPYPNEDYLAKKQNKRPSPQKNSGFDEKAQPKSFFGDEPKAEKKADSDAFDWGDEEKKDAPKKEDDPFGFDDGPESTDKKKEDPFGFDDKPAEKPAGGIDEIFDQPAPVASAT